MSRCTCGARNACPPISPAQRTSQPAVDGRPDPAEHFASEGGHTLLGWLLGPSVALRLGLYAELWRRDGPGSPWHREYWQTWERAHAAA